MCAARGMRYQSFWTLTGNPDKLRAAPGGLGLGLGLGLVIGLGIGSGWVRVRDRVRVG